MIDEVFILKAKDGRDVKVHYMSHFFGEHSPCMHLEFRGYAISETGYRSHFFGNPLSKEYISAEEAKKLAIELVDELYIPPVASQTLLF